MTQVGFHLLSFKTSVLKVLPSRDENFEARGGFISWAQSIELNNIEINKYMEIKTFH